MRELSREWLDPGGESERREEVEGRADRGKIRRAGQDIMRRRGQREEMEREP
jgi:hypothetical protein